MSRLQELANMARGSVHVSVNKHRDYEQSVEAWIGDGEEHCSIDAGELPRDVKAQMVAASASVVLFCCPRNSGGAFRVFHHDVDLAIEQALERCAKEIAP